MEFPIKGITTNIGSEIEGMRQALKYISNNCRGRYERTIILCDSKFVVNAIHNKVDSDAYRLPIAECQEILKSLNKDDIPEIYWIKGHSGIPGNERADIVSKRARLTAQLQQPNLYKRPDKSASFLNNRVLSPF